jgi:transposase
MVAVDVRAVESPPDWIAPQPEAEFREEEYARAAQRETALQEKILQLERAVEQQSAQVLDLTQQNEALKYQIAWLVQQVFGRKSEESKNPDPANNHGQDHENTAPQETSPDETKSSPQATGQDGCPTEEDSSEGRRKRGKQKGAKGYGRKPRLNLPFIEILHELPLTKQCCPICGKSFLVFPGTEDSEEIHWEVRLVRHIHQRARYKPDCDCQAVPGIVTAPPPPKLIPKGLLAADFWVRLILEKFLFQRPLYRVRQMLALNGLSISQGTLTGGLKKIKSLLEPLYLLIVEWSRAAKHWQMDETRWMVFADLEGKKGHRWWLWVVVTKETVVYLLDPTRSAKVPKNHLGEKAEGILNVDRYSAYKALHDLIRLAFCWSHQRRDFIKIRDGYGRLRPWADNWIQRIDQLFHINAGRLKALFDPQAFQDQNRILRKAVLDMAGTWEKELLDDTLHPVQKGALKSLKNHWTGLTIFVDHPHVPMDNNESERRLRNPILGRKNYYGSGSIWSGILSAMLFTILQTLLINRIDPQKFLLAYFEACAQNGGKAPEDIASFLPWNLSEERKEAWQIKESFP